MALVKKVYEELVSRLELAGSLGPLSIGPELFGVVLLDSLKEFTALGERAKRVGDWFTQGVLVAPAAGTVMADTLALPIGTYDCLFVMFGGNIITLDLEWRNAANTANLVAQRVQVNLDNRMFQVRMVLEIESVNERFRVITVDAGVAGTGYQSSILARAL